MKRPHFPNSSSLECQILAQLFTIHETLERLFHFSETLVLYRQNKIKCLLYSVPGKIRDYKIRDHKCLPTLISVGAAVVTDVVLMVVELLCIDGAHGVVGVSGGVGDGAGGGDSGESDREGGVSSAVVVRKLLSHTERTSRLLWRV